MRKFTIQIGEELSNYLEKLTYEIESKKSIIDYMFESHKMDTDASLFESPVWKQYEKDYQETFIEFDMAKNEASKLIMETIRNKFGKNIDCDWRVTDFKERTIEVTLREDATLIDIIEETDNA